MSIIEKENVLFSTLMCLVMYVTYTYMHIYDLVIHPVELFSICGELFLVPSKKLLPHISHFNLFRKRL